MGLMWQLGSRRSDDRLLEGDVAGKFELYADKAGKFRFRLKASNGEIIAMSGAYESKASARTESSPSARTLLMLRSSTRSESS